METLDPIAIQRRYYAENAGSYDLSHDRAEHRESLLHIAHYLQWIGAESVLDTGCGTGMALRYLRDAIPGLQLRGNDPSSELLTVATEQYDIPTEQLDQVGSEALPYDDGEFDAVIETGVLHHVPRAADVVAEMLRVSRKAIFISDENAFGMGSFPVRLAKLALSRAGALRAVNRVRRGFKDWYYTEGDGVAWTYSVFDSVPELRASCAEIVVIPVGEIRPGVEQFPLLQARHCLLAGFKTPLPPLARGT